MRDYSKVSPQFWTGETGRAIRGDLEAQMVALYLMTSPHSNMIGVFTCPLVYISHEIGIPLEGASKGLSKLVQIGFCTYDHPLETVFIHEMASYQIGVSLKPTDNQVKSVCKEFAAIPESIIKQAFYKKYCEAYHLPKIAPSKPLSKPLGSQEQEQEQEQEHKQEQEGGEETSNSVDDYQDFAPNRKKISENFVPDETCQRFALTNRVNLDFECQKFIAHYQANSEERKDWQAAFRKWILQAAQYNAEDVKKQQSGNSQDMKKAAAANSILSYQPDPAEPDNVPLIGDQDVIDGQYEAI